MIVHVLLIAVTYVVGVWDPRRRKVAVRLHLVAIMISTCQAIPNASMALIGSVLDGFIVQCSTM